MDEADKKAILLESEMDDRSHSIDSEAVADPGYQWTRCGVLLHIKTRDRKWQAQATNWKEPVSCPECDDDP